jgi:tRNA A-37 threonylcarbamoyl transferase component Bud32
MRLCWKKNPYQLNIQVKLVSDMTTELSREKRCELATWAEQLKLLNLPCDSFETLGAGTTSTAVGTSNGCVVLRANPFISPDVAIECYKKQQWCAQQALASGVSTVQIRNVVQNKQGIFAVLDRAHGKDGKALINESSERDPSLGNEVGSRIMKQLGSQAKLLHGIRIEGFGPLKEIEAGRWIGSFDSWHAFAKFRFDSLINSSKCCNDDRHDTILSRKIIDKKELSLIHEKLRELQDWAQEPTLCHLDLRPCNSIIDEMKITVIDWGMARADAGIVAELGAFMSCGIQPSMDHCTALLYGYGVAPDRISELIEKAKLIVIENALLAARDLADSPSMKAKTWLAIWLKIIKENLT